MNSILISSSITLGEWNTITITQDAIGFSDIFINGVKKITRVQLSSIAGDLAVGGAPFDAAGATLKVDDIVRYNGRLSEDIILKNAMAANCGYVLQEHRNNKAPFADAGKYRRINTSVAKVTLLGEASDDLAVISTQWELVSGPQAVSFANAHTLQPTIAFTAPGLYIFELAVSDGEMVTKSRTEVIVSDELCDVQAKGLVKYWSFNGHSDEYYSNDVSRGSSFEIEYGPGYVTQSLTSQKSSKLELANDFNPFQYEDWSMDFWVKYGGSNGVLFHWGGGAKLHLNSGSLRLEAKVNSVSGISTGNLYLQKALNDDKWHHVSLVHKAGEFRGYIDSELVIKQQLDVVRSTFAGSLQLGSSDFSVTNGFSGGLDELGFYNRALLPTEVSKFFGVHGKGKCVFEGNDPPQVDAGKDLWVDLNEKINLRGRASDDEGIRNIYWTKLSGPGNLVFSDSSLLNTSVVGDQKGLYVIKLTVDDGKLVRSDTIEVYVGSGCNIPLPKGTTNWWSFNNHSRDLIGESNATSFGEGSYQTGFVNESYKLRDLGENIEYLEIEGSNNEMNPILGSDDKTWTIEFWTKYEGNSGRLIYWDVPNLNDNYIRLSSGNINFYYALIP